MPTFKNKIRLTGGQVTDLPFNELAINSYRQVQNFIGTPEGMSPIHSLCDAIGPTISNIANNAVGFPMVVFNGSGYFNTNNGLTSLALYDVGAGLFTSDNHATTVAGTIRDTAVTTTAWSALSTSQQIASMLKNPLFMYGNSLIYKLDIVLTVALDILNAVNRRHWDIFELTSSDIIDVEGSLNNLGPRPQKFLVHDEYLMAFAGFDGYTHNISTTNGAHILGNTVINLNSTPNMVNGDIIGFHMDDGTWHYTTVVSFVPGVSVTILVGLPSTLADARSVYYATVLEEHTTFARWNHPTDINRWHPSTALPPDNLAGFKQYMSYADFIDAFVFNSVVYVITSDNMFRMQKVGGETGYTMKELNVQTKLGYGAQYSLVPTSNAVYLMTLEGLYAFNGQSMTPISAGQNEEFFNKLWFREKISDTLYSEGSAIQSIQHGIHVPILDCLMWFVTYGTVGNETNMVLVYNYESGTASYLLPPANEIWYPMVGDYVGITVYDKLANTVRAFAFRPKTSSAIPPNAELLLESGFITGAENDQNLLADRMYFILSPQATGDVFSGLSLAVTGYDQQEVLHETKAIGVMSDGYVRGFHDVRISGRFIGFKLQGSPNAYTDWTQNLNQSISSIKSYQFEIKRRGGRA